MGRVPDATRYRTIPALALAMALAVPAWAQAPTPDLVDPGLVDPGLVDPDAALVEELVVTGRLPGPAFWRVEDADTVVHVLGVPSVAPRRMAWDQAIFANRLKGANAVIVPAKGLRVRLASAPAAAVSYLRLRSSTPYEATLEPAGRARFAAARERLGQSAGRYGTKNPLAAGLLLITDYRERHDLTDSDPGKLIRLLAAQAGVPVVDRNYDLSPLLGAVIKVPREAGQACLDAALGETEAGPQATLVATRAWAVGDVRGALGAERTYERCLAAAPGAAAFDARIKADTAAQITQALRTPGHAIAVVQLRPLLSQGGVLDRLRGLPGVSVKTPGDL